MADPRSNTRLSPLLQIEMSPWQWPSSDFPWGLTSAYHDCGGFVVGLADPIVEMVGEKKAKIVMKTPGGAILSLCHIYDEFGNELVQDKGRDVKYTVLLNKRNPLPQAAKDDEEVSIVGAY